MCIRDSYYGGDISLLLVDRTDLSLRYMRGKVEGDDRISKAVSYTHLRAHETVLDLVCRLLLEKKKKSPTQATT